MKMKYYLILTYALSLGTVSSAYSMMNEENFDDMKVLITNPRDHGGGTIMRFKRGEYILHDIGNSPGKTLDPTQFVEEIRRDANHLNQAIKLTFITSHPQEDAFNLIKPTIEELIRRKINIYIPYFVFGGNYTNYQRTEKSRELIDYLKNNFQILPVYSNTDKGLSFSSSVSLHNNAISFLNPCAGGTYRGPGRHYTHSLNINYDDLNRLSLVTSIKSGNISVILPGGSKSFERVVAAADSYNFDLNSDKFRKIVITSHHSGDGCMDEDNRYYNHIKPQYVVSSVSSNFQYNHPYSESIVNSLNSIDIIDFNTMGYPGHLLQHYSRNINQWNYTPTTKAIFSTLTQGNINFTWNIDDLYPRIGHSSPMLNQYYTYGYYNHYSNQ